MVKFNVRGLNENMNEKKSIFKRLHKTGTNDLFVKLKEQSSKCI